MKYVILTILTIIFTGIGFYFLFNETLAEKLETENQKILEEYAESQIDCYRKASSSGTSDQISQKYDECILRPKPKLKTISGDRNSGSGKIMNATGGIAPVPSQITDKLSQLHKRVCEKQVNSPLCKDKALFDKLYHLTEERLPGKNFYPILLGITNAESSLGLNFAKDRVGGTCEGRNNWGGTKYKINDDNTRDFSSPKFGYDYKKKGKDDYGCYLYPFESIEEFWITKVNGMRFGYPGCINHKTPIRCLAFRYVGDPNVAEESWIRNTSLFL